MIEITKKEWLLEEYRLLTQHYFHEDNYYLKSNTVFMTLNTAMLAFVGSFSDEFMFVFSSMGIMSVCAWTLTLLRTRFLRVKIENRIKELETFVQRAFKADSSTGEHTDILNLRANSILTPWYARTPATVIMLILPTVFASIWVYFLCSNRLTSG